ncbi:MAG TPA: hypothetical protein VF478_00370 [Anaerolineae bacterium]
MPKVKKPTKVNSTKTPTRKTSAGKKTRVRAPAAVRTPKPTYSEEYAAYLERHALIGAGHPRLSSDEFDRLDDEMLDLLDQEFKAGLNDEQIIRLQELEFLLLDSE